MVSQAWYIEQPQKKLGDIRTFYDTIASDLLTLLKASSITNVYTDWVPIWQIDHTHKIGSNSVNSVTKFTGLEKSAVTRTLITLVNTHLHTILQKSEFR